jgi:SAM-dependent methyltransferase
MGKRIGTKLESGTNKRKRLAPQHGTQVAPLHRVIVAQHKVDEMLRRLESGEPVADSVFDQLYPWSQRMQSPAFWTPVAVALRATELLVPKGTGRVLDVGSGVGKLCIVGAASTNAHFVGIEQREHLVRIAKDAARRVGLVNAHFVHDTFDRADVGSYDAIYFFNPFEENLWPPAAHLDHTVELSEARFVRDAASAHRLLDAARIGTRVVTYHGLGVEMPPQYEHVSRERAHSGSLDLWVKSEPLARCG